MNGSITKAAVSALRWTYLGFVIRSGSNFFIGLFLARLLGPKPFGQLAVASLIMGLANLLADAGFTSALVQAPSLSKIQIRYAVTLQFLIAAGLTGLCFLIAGPAALWFRDPGVRDVLRAISPLFVLQAFGQVSNAVLRRELAFKTIQTIQVLSYFVGYLLVGVPLAFYGAGVWSLVVAQLAQAGVYSALLYIRVRHSFIPSFHRSGRVLLRFGAKVTMSNIVNYGISNSDNFVVGRVFGSTSLGFYNRGFALANAPSDGVVSAMQQVLFASCSRAEGRLEPIRRAYLACLAALAIIILPAFWAMSACATTVMVGLYGEKWRPAAVLFRPLVIAVSINALMALAGSILGALDRVEHEIRAQAMSFAVAVLVFFLAGRYSTLTGLAWGVCGVYLFRFVAATRPTLHALGLKWSDALRVLSGPFVIACVIAVLLRGVDQVAGRIGLQPLPALVVLIVAGVAIFVTSLVLLGRWLLATEFLELLRGFESGVSGKVLALLLPSRRRANQPVPGN